MIADIQRGQWSMGAVKDCVCGHNLGQHPPDPNRPFSWPCRACDCQEFTDEPREEIVYILERFAVDQHHTLLYVHVARGWDGRWVVLEGLG